MGTHLFTRSKILLQFRLVDSNLQLAEFKTVARARRHSGVNGVTGSSAVKSFRIMERETRFELATSSLGSWHSTTELLPQSLERLDTLTISQSHGTEHEPRYRRAVRGSAISDSTARRFS